MTEQVPTEVLSKAVAKFFQCGQSDRGQVLNELVELSRQGTEALAGVKSALKLILDSGTHGRVSAATEFLVRLGSPLVTRLAQTEQVGHGKLGYAVVRALGALGEREYVFQFIGRGADESIREGVAEALDDIGDEPCLQSLQNMRDNDESAFIRRLAGELLQDH